MNIYGWQIDIDGEGRANFPLRFLFLERSARISGR